MVDEIYSDEIYKVINESLPIFLDSAVRQCGDPFLILLITELQSQLGGGFAAVAISTTAIGQRRCRFQEQTPDFVIKSSLGVPFSVLPDISCRDGMSSFFRE